MKFIKINNESDISELINIIKERDSFMRFFSPFCGWCRAMEENWNELENKSNLKNKDINIIDINVALLHSDEANNKLTHDVFNVAKENGVPYIVLVNTNGKLVSEYKGNRETDDMILFIDNNMKQKTSKNKKNTNKQKGGKRKTNKKKTHKTTKRKTNKRKTAKRKTAKRKTNKRKNNKNKDKKIND